MQFCFDRTGFPLVDLPDLEVQVHLLPVSKVQLERFLMEPNEFDDAWYETLLRVHGRVSYRRFSENERERVFVGGILPLEAVAFAQWLGPDFRLPTVIEWRKVYKRMEQLPIEESTWHALLEACSAPAKDILEQLRNQMCPHRWLELSLLTGGLVEWVVAESATEQERYAGLGKPRRSFQPGVWNPLQDIIRPVSLEQRVSYFGFRLVETKKRRNK